MSALEAEGAYKCEVDSIGGVPIGTTRSFRARERGSLNTARRALAAVIDVDKVRAEGADRLAVALGVDPTPKANETPKTSSPKVSFPDSLGAKWLTLRADQTPEKPPPSLEVTFQLRALRPCPGCTGAEAVVLGADVFDAAFALLREQAESERLSRIFCVYAELAGAINNCKADLEDVEGTTLDVEWVDVLGSPTTAPTTHMQWPPTPSPTVKPPSAPPTKAPEETLEVSIYYNLSDDCEEFTAENILTGTDGNTLKEDLIAATTHLLKNTRVCSSTMKTEEPTAYCKKLGLALAAGGLRGAAGWNRLRRQHLPVPGAEDLQDTRRHPQQHDL